MKTLYAALRPSAEAAQDLQNSVGPRRGSLPAGVAMAPMADWHITLAYLGETEDSSVAPVSALLAGLALVHGPLKLALAEAGTFSDGRVLWFGLTGETERLDALAQRTRHYLNADTTYPFVAHLTVAKSDDSVDLSPMAEHLATYRGPTWSADRLHLMSSVSGDGWPVDESIASWPMTGRS